MTRQANPFTYLITAILTALFIICIPASGGAQFASAAASSCSDVLDDLRLDESFNIEEYPAVPGDYKLEVKQIAESSSGELLIYVYQPAARQDVQACTICIAREMDNSVGLGFKDYSLEYLNNNGVFFKYRVKDFELKADAIRYYNISNILRPFDKLIDDPPGGGNTASEVPYAVGQFWTACTVNGTVTYTMTETEVIEVTEKYVGRINYEEGFKLGWTSTNSATTAHFVAFDTDKPIDKLISASVSFSEREVTCQRCANLAHSDALNGHAYKSEFNYQYGTEKRHDPVKLTSKCQILDVGKNKYTMNRIRTTSEFLADAEGQKLKMTAGNYANVQGTKWVLNFYETPIEVKTNGSEWAMALSGLAALFSGVDDLDCRYTEVSDVMILRLEFETDGKHYNLGVVDNKQTGSNKPWGGNPGTGCNTNWEWLNAVPIWSWFLIVVGIIIAIVVFVLLISWLIRLLFRKAEERRERRRIKREIAWEQKVRREADLASKKPKHKGKKK